MKHLFITGIFTGIIIMFLLDHIVRRIVLWIKDVNYRIEIMKCDRTNIYARLEALEKREK